MSLLCYLLKNVNFELTKCGIVPRQDLVRWASKKASGSTRNRTSGGRPKRRGIKINDGAFAHAGSRLVVQFTPIFHPGLNVGFGKDGTLFAMEAGKVVVSCEKMDPNWNHTWIERHYGGRVGQVMYKKYFHIIPEEQHRRFKLIEEV